MKIKEVKSYELLSVMREKRYGDSVGIGNIDLSDLP